MAKLNLPIRQNDAISHFKITADGQRVIYTTQFPTDSSDQLFSVSITGGESTVLNPALLSNRIISEFKISPDSRFVVFKGDIYVDNRFEIYSVPMLGGEVIKLNTVDRNGQAFLDFEVTPNSDRVIFSKTDPNFKTDLVSVPIRGGTQVIMYPTRTNGASGLSLSKYSADGRSILLGFSYGLFAVEDLFVASIDGSGPPLHVVKRSTSDFEITDAEFDRDNQLILFTGVNLGETSNGQLHLFKAQIKENAVPVQLTPVLPNTIGVRSQSIHPDGKHVVYRAPPGNDSSTQLFQIPIAGGPPELLSGLSKVNTTISSFKVSKDGKHMLFTQKFNSTFAQQLFVTSFADKKITALNEALIPTTECAITFDVKSSISN